MKTHTKKPPNTKVSYSPQWQNGIKSVNNLPQTIERAAAESGKKQL